jgi:histone H1/5
MAYKRKKGGQTLMEMSRKSGQRKRATAKKLRDQVRRNVAGGSKTPAQRAAVIKRKGTTITYKPKPSSHLKPAAKKAAPKSVAKKAAPKAVAKKAKKSDAQKLKDYRKNPAKGMAPRNLRTPAQRAALKKRLKNQGSEAAGMSKLASGLTKDIGDAEFATDLAITAATLPLGGGLGRGALTGAKAVGRGAKAVGGALKTGAKVTGKAVKTGAKAAKRATRIARVAAKKADRKLLKAQGLSRQGGKVRKIKEPNPFGKNAAKGSKPKTKGKSGKKNPFAGSDKPKTKPKRAARKARKAGEQDAHVKAYKGNKVKQGKRKADQARKDAVAANKRAADKAEALRIEKGYAQQKIAARKASRNRRRRS